MSHTPENLLTQLKEIEEQIQEVEARLPAHSVKPPIMQELFALEDERSRILKKLRDRAVDASSDIRKGEGKN